MGKKKGILTSPTPSASDKGKRKTKEKSSTRAPAALTISEKHDPKMYKVKLPNPEAKRRWSHLCQLRHKHCRFLHMETIRAMGIADDVLTLTENLGFTRIFQANYLAYHGITLEFLSTLEVKRANGTPQSLKFQLGGAMRKLTVNELNAIINGPEDGAYTGSHTFDPREMWKKLMWVQEERAAIYNPTYAKASSVHNPVFRYLHRLISSTILSRQDVGTFLSNDFHILWASLNRIPQSAGCYLADHMEHQAYLHGSQKIGIGAFITPIAMHFNVHITGDPVSRDIFLDKRSLQQQEMLAYDPDRYLWKLHGRHNNYLFPLPNTALTSVFGDAPAVLGRWNMSTREHLDLMWVVGEAPRMQAPRGDVREERAEEEAAYEQGGEQPREEPVRRQGGFRMQAPDFEDFGQRFFNHSDQHHQDILQAQDNYYMQSRQWVQDQVGEVRQEVVGLRGDFGAMRSQLDQILVSQQDHVEEERRYREDERLRREREQVQQAQYWAQQAQHWTNQEHHWNQEANYQRMIQEMYQSWPYFPEGHQRFNPQDPPFPPPQ